MSEVVHGRFKIPKGLEGGRVSCREYGVLASTDVVLLVFLQEGAIAVSTKEA